MTTIITRLYSSKEEADRVIAGLREQDYRIEELGVIAGPDNPEVRGDEYALRSQMMSAGVFENAAKVYAERVATAHLLSSFMRLSDGRKKRCALSTSITR